jgi:hypothetical protein
MKFSYCQSQIEGGKCCKIQCGHCEEYYYPLEKRALLEKQLVKIEKELNGCRTSVIEDGWQTMRYAKKARKWDILSKQKFDIQSKLDEL